MTFEGLFESSTFDYALTTIKIIIEIALKIANRHHQYKLLFTYIDKPDLFSSLESYSFKGTSVKSRAAMGWYVRMITNCMLY